MNDPQAQLQDVEDLEASVDALMQDIEASSERVERQVQEVSGEIAVDAPANDGLTSEDAEFADFETAHAALDSGSGASTPHPGASGAPAPEMDASKSALDELLGGIGEETDASEAAGATDAGKAAIEDIDAAFASVESLAAEAPVPDHAGTEDPGKQAELERRANQEPIGDIEELDKALAQSAEAVMADAQRAPVPAAAMPAPAPVAEPVARTPEPELAAVAVAVAAAAPVEIKPAARERLGSALAPIGHAATVALMPLHSLHAKLPESTRQTVAYIAIMNVFFASVVWFMALRPRPEAEVSYDVKAIYLSEQAAREAEREAKAKAEAESKKGGHGEEKKKDGGHGEAKKPEKKDAGGHGEAKKPDTKAAAKKDAGHGGGH